MNAKLEESLNNVELLYGELIEIANDILNPITTPINTIINEISANVNNLTIDQIRDYILRLQLKAFELGDVKEKSALKADLAEALQKEQFAIKFNGMEGSAAAKDKLATVATSAETVSEALYSLLASLLKTKLDAIHRMIDSLKSILMSRMQETKFMQMSLAADGSNPYQQPTTRQILNEQL